MSAVELGKSGLLRTSICYSSYQQMGAGWEVFWCLCRLFLYIENNFYVSSVLKINTQFSTNLEISFPQTFIFIL